MITFLFAISFSQHTSKTQPENFTSKSNIENKSQDLYYSKEGFYKVTLHETDTINVNFLNKSLRLFFFIPDHQNYFIRELIIDGKAINYVEYKGLLIEGNKSATIKFATNSADQKIPAEFWLIRSSFCQNPSVYLYGNQKMEFGTTVGNKLCIFSPSFDSKNHEFKIRFGITKEFKQSYSKLYTKNFDSPDEINSGTEIRSYNIEGSSFVQFYGDYFYANKSTTSKNNHSKSLKSKKFLSKIFKFKQKMDYSGFFVYERTTKIKKVEKTSCNVLFIYKCKSKGCWSDFLPEFHWGCSDSKNLNIFMVLAIVLSIAVLLIIVSWFAIICVKKKNKEKESYFSSILSDKNDGNINRIQPSSYT